MKRFIIRSNGQGMIEYLIVVSLVAIASIAILRVVGQNLTSRFSNIAYALQGKEKSARYDQVEKSHFKKKDLGDFFKGAATKDQ